MVFLPNKVTIDWNSFPLQTEPIPSQLIVPKTGKTGAF